MRAHVIGHPDSRRRRVLFIAVMTIRRYRCAKLSVRMLACAGAAESRESGTRSMNGGDHLTLLQWVAQRHSLMVDSAIVNSASNDRHVTRRGASANPWAGSERTHESARSRARIAKSWRRALNRPRTGGGGSDRSGCPQVA